MDLRSQQTSPMTQSMLDHHFSGSAYRVLGDFLESFHLFRLWKPDGSKCRTWAISHRVSSEPPQPPSLSYSTLRPFGKLGGSTPLRGTGLSRSCSWPTPASSQHRSVSSHSSEAPRYPSTVQSDYIYCGKVGNTTAESACRWHRQAAPCDTEIASAYHYSLDHYPF